MTPDDLLELFDATAAAIARALAGTTERRARTDRPGQYALDVVADEAALGVLGRAPVAVVSEESGRSGPPDAAVTVVIDPVDGSTNCSRGIPYWGTSLCAVDADGPLAALVANLATGVRTTAVRGEGTRRDGTEVSASGVHRVEDALVAVSGMPARALPWKQYRALGSVALALCDIAAGAVDGYVDGGDWHSPWDYLGGLLACVEAGATVIDLGGRPLAVTDPGARRQLLVAATPELLEELRPAARVVPR
ncbi:MAG: inositol monophosphatase [Acidimicrobiia bacterium]|nr:inositol monophosphatase [Acidimicrobiia bacterium]